MAVAGKVSRGRDRRTAYVPLKHDSERITERWARTGRREEPGAAVTAPVAGSRPPVEISPTATRASLYKIAKRLAVKGRSTMTRKQLVEAITRAGGSTARKHR